MRQQTQRLQRAPGEFLSHGSRHFDMAQQLSLLIFLHPSALVNGLVSSDNVAVIKKTDISKKLETQTLSPSKRSGMKPAVRQTRPIQHHSCPRRRLTGDKLAWFVTQLVLSAGVTSTAVPHHIHLPVLAYI